MPSGRPVALYLVLLALLCGLLVGCGGGQSGGGEQEAGGGQEAGSGGDGQQGGGRGEKPNKDAPETKIALGTLTSSDTENRRITLRPARDAQGDKPIKFKVRKTAEISVGGKEAEMSGIKEGQQAQVEYVVKNDVNRATAVELFEGG